MGRIDHRFKSLITSAFMHIEGLSKHNIKRKNEKAEKYPSRKRSWGQDSSLNGMVN